MLARAARLHSPQPTAEPGGGVGLINAPLQNGDEPQLIHGVCYDELAPEV